MQRIARLPSNARPRNAGICFSCRWRRPTSPSQQIQQVQQKRWITRKHIRKIKDAMQDWEQRAEGISKGEKQSMLSLLEERGYVHQIVGTREDLDYLLTQRRIGAYVGVDATAPSLHIGHLVPLMALGWLFIHGYSITFLLGGVTARIGDPTDRLDTRERGPRSQRKANMANMHLGLKKLGARLESYAERKGYVREWAWRREVANNSVWYSKLPLSEFLRVLGDGTRMGPLLGRDTVKKRLEGGDGMSFSEFSYTLLQAWDWWEMFKRGVQLQIGGADQYGNILTGVEVIKASKKVEPVHFESEEAFQGHVGHHSTASESNLPRSGGNINEPIGFTVPLLTTSAGAKFGKSAGNAVWLDSEMTSSFDLYQFCLRTADADVERYLRLFTFIPTAEIRFIMEEHWLDESKRIAQHRLAYDLVEIAHGLGAARDASKQHRLLFGSNLSIDSIRTDQVKSTEEEARPPGDWNSMLNEYAKPATASSAPSVHLKLPRSLVEDRTLPKVLWSAGLVSSRGEGQRLISTKGCKVGSKTGRGASTATMGDGLAFTTPDNGNALAREYIIEGDLLIFRVGKWKMKIITLVSDEEYERLGLTCPGWKDENGDDAGREEDPVGRRREIRAFRSEKKQKRSKRHGEENQQAPMRDDRMETD